MGCDPERHWLTSLGEIKGAAHESYVACTLLHLVQ